MSKCLVCEAAALEEMAGFSTLPRVTSDCKPFAAGGRLMACARCGALQKLPDARWQAEIAAIYSAYDIYAVAQGAEQLVFTADGAAPRSARLVEALRSQTQLPARGRLIDIGCGNGAALANFSTALPAWDLYGSELSSAGEARLRRLPNFRELYTVPIGDIPGRYDVVAMIHSLEHMPAPGEALRGAARLLADGGVIFVEMPDAETSPFDLLIADHLLHLSQATLGLLCARLGVQRRVLTNRLLPKELTLIAQAGSSNAPPPDPAAGKAMAQSRVAWLHRVIESAREARRASRRFGLFGTSIAAMWLYGALDEAADFFVDEDPARIGNTCAGKPVYAPGQVPAGSDVYVPLSPQTAAALAARLASPRARYVTPPPAP